MYGIIDEENQRTKPLCISVVFDDGYYGNITIVAAKITAKSNDCGYE